MEQILLWFFHAQNVFRNSVNVICGGDPFGMRTAAYTVVVTPLEICMENKKDSNKSESSSYNI